jgi:hypothetical protein
MQQRTSVLGASHPVRGLVGLARQMALPHEYAPERFPSFPALERTAVMSFNSPTTLTVGHQNALMVCRQAAYPAWGRWTNGHSGTQYTGVWQAGTTDFGSAVITERQVNFNNPYMTMVANNTSPATDRIAIAGYVPFPYPQPVMGVDAGLSPYPFIYVPAGAALQTIIGFNDFAINTLVATSLEFEIWTSAGEGRRGNLNGNIPANVRSGLLGTSTFSDNTWIRPVMATFNVNPGQATFSKLATVCFVVTFASSNSFVGSSTDFGTLTGSGVSTSTPFFPLTYPNEFLNSPLPWRSTRTTASAVLATNVTQVLNKAGTVLSGRVNPQQYDPFNVTSNVIGGLHPAEKAFLPLETGYYTYCAPSTDLQTFADTTVGIGLTANLTLAPVYRLDNTSLVNVAFFTGVVGLSETLALNIDWHIEFRTTSTLFNIAMCGLTLETFHQAQLALAQAGYFFENPEHKGILNKVMAATRKYGPDIVSVVNPTVGKMLKGAIAITRKPNTSVPTTSAVSSGMMKGAKAKNMPRKPKQDRRKQEKKKR